MACECERRVHARTDAAGGSVSVDKRGGRVGGTGCAGEAECSTSSAGRGGRGFPQPRRLQRYTGGVLAGSSGRASRVCDGRWLLRWRAGVSGPTGGVSVFVSGARCERGVGAVRLRRLRSCDLG